MISTPEIQAKIAMWRKRAFDGNLSREEMHEATALLRAGRVQAAATVKVAKAAKKAAVLDGDDLIAELGGL